MESESESSLTWENMRVVMCMRRVEEIIIRQEIKFIIQVREA